MTKEVLKQALGVTHCQCEACKNGNIHDSDCSVHNGDALPVGPCDCSLATPPLVVGLTKQAEPVAWDKPSASFDEWWDSDRRRDTANPFTTDSFAFWAFEGWQAALAQRPWVGLTEEEIMVIGDKVANEELVGLVSNFRVRLARAIEQTLKEKNHD